MSFCVAGVAGCLRIGPQPLPQPETSSERVCTGDWHAHGREAGRSGAALGVLQQWLKDCPTPDEEAARAAFREGHAEGLADFCSLSVQYQRGRLGQDFRPVCPRGERAALRQAFEHGREVYSRAMELRRDDQRLADIRQFSQMGSLSQRERERFGDEPTAEIRANERAWRALHKLDAEYRERYGAPPMPYQSRHGLQ